MQDFDGTAFVAFADLCGFKELMRNRRKAYDALNRLYNKAYDLGQDHPRIQALAVSDCVVAWTDAGNATLDALLTYLKSLHQELLDGGYLMRTTIARGRFQYQQRINLQNLEKGMMYGGAYLTAYRKNEKAEPGSILIVSKNALGDPATLAPQHSEFIRRVREGDRADWEFFWSVCAPDEIDRLRRARRDSYQARFAHLVRAYRRPSAARRLNTFQNRGD